MLIGLDLDNTIINYDMALRRVAEEQGCFPPDWDGSKNSLRDFLRSGPGGDMQWQKVQAKIYGSHIDQADFYPGFVEFIHCARAKGHRLVVVSHKTEISPVDESRILLRVAAIRWLDRKGFFSHLGFSFNDIHFCSSQDKKCRKIAEIQCDLFVDDLREVFENGNFPDGTRKALFAPASKESPREPDRSFASWRSLADAEFGGLKPTEIVSLCCRKFPGLGVTNAEPLQGRANSRVFRLESVTSANQYFLKIYPDQALDPRKRLQTEWAALETLRRHGLPVPKTVQACPDLNWAVYEWVSGNHPATIGEKQIRQANDFLEQINQIPRESFSFLQEASEACLSGSALENQIRSRLSLFYACGHPVLKAFVETEVISILEALLARAKESWPVEWSASLPYMSQVLSPSDFGFHNAIESTSGKLVFFDMEYFGWDDPVKLVADIFWHPAFAEIEEELKKVWLKQLRDNFLEDPAANLRYQLSLPLYGIRWVLIILNMVRKEMSKIAEKGTSLSSNHFELLMEKQIQKARSILSRLKTGLEVPCGK